MGHGSQHHLQAEALPVCTTSYLTTTTYTWVQEASWASTFTSWNPGRQGHTAGAGCGGAGGG
jgi:hypothetical protein